MFAISVVGNLIPTNAKACDRTNSHMTEVPTAYGLIELYQKQQTGTRSRSQMYICWWSRTGQCKETNGSWSSCMYVGLSGSFPIESSQLHKNRQQKSGWQMYMYRVAIAYRKLWLHKETRQICLSVTYVSRIIHCKLSTNLGNWNHHRPTCNRSCSYSGSCQVCSRILGYNLHWNVRIHQCL